METTVQASLQRADKEIKTALKKLVDSASMLVTLPPGMRGGAGGLGLAGSVPSDHVETASGPPVLVHEASTQTQAAGGHGRSGMNLENVPWKSRQTKMLNTPITTFFPPLIFMFCCVLSSCRLRGNIQTQGNMGLWVGVRFTSFGEDLSRNRRCLKTVSQLEFGSSPAQNGVTGFFLHLWAFDPALASGFLMEKGEWLGSLLYIYRSNLVFEWGGEGKGGCFSFLVCHKRAGNVFNTSISNARDLLGC